MAEHTHQTKTSDASCSSSLMLVAFRLGYLQATCNQILARVSAMSAPTAPPPSGPSLWTTAKEYLTGFVLLHKAWSAWRAISWPVSLGVWASAVAKFLGFW